MTLSVGSSGKPEGVSDPGVQLQTGWSSEEPRRLAQCQVKSGGGTEAETCVDPSRVKKKQIQPSENTRGVEHVACEPVLAHRGFNLVWD